MKNLIFWGILIGMLLSSSMMAQVPCQANFAFKQVPNTLTVDFKNLSVASATVVYTWDYGDGVTTTGLAPSHSYAAPGTYKVCLLASDGTNACTVSFCQNVVVAPLTDADCNAAFSYQLTAGSYNVQFKEIGSTQSNASVVSWSFGDGTGSTNHNPTHLYTAPGFYTVCLTTVQTNGCSTSYCKVVPVGQSNASTCLAKYTIISATTTGQSKYFKSLSIGTTPQTVYTWDFGDGTVANGPTQTHSYTQAGQYNICLYISDPSTGCASQFCQLINFFKNIDNSNKVDTILVPGKYLTGGVKVSLVNHFPNPASTYTQIQYQLEEDADVTIEVYDPNGNRVGQTYHAFETQGEHFQDINLEGQRSGFYLIKMNVGNEILLRRIYVVKS
ncbi:MAG: PKD domain-containing protein [Bacteroidetes bacterium]|nr:PKD domain-containing protein [Bacteroidota bacterium]